VLVDYHRLSTAGFPESSGLAVELEDCTDGHPARPYLLFDGKGLGESRITLDIHVSKPTIARLNIHSSQCPRELSEAFRKAFNSAGDVPGTSYAHPPDRPIGRGAAIFARAALFETTDHATYQIGNF
jgi:hypothetical protein